jgi:hypothetical protein
MNTNGIILYFPNENQILVNSDGALNFWKQYFVAKLLVYYVLDNLYIDGQMKISMQDFSALGSVPKC